MGLLQAVMFNFCCLYDIQFLNVWYISYWNVATDNSNKIDIATVLDDCFLFVWVFLKFCIVWVISNFAVNTICIKFCFISNVEACNSNKLGYVTALCSIVFVCFFPKFALLGCSQISWFFIVCLKFLFHFKYQGL
jgi:hypothetical protein